MDLFEQTLFASENSCHSTVSFETNDLRSNVLEDNLSFGNVCAYCGETKKSAMLPACQFIEDHMIVSIDPNDKMLFCDFLCAKLYNDNIEAISINFKEYRQLYLTNKLDKTAKDVYDRCKNTLFVMLPIYKTDSTNYKLNRQKLKATI